MPESIRFGSEVRKARKLLGISQSVVAKEVGTRRDKISRIERGFKIRDSQLIERIKKFLKIEDSDGKSAEVKIIEKLEARWQGAIKKLALCENENELLEKRIKKLKKKLKKKK